MGEVVTVVLSLRSSPIRVMEALRHQHSYVFVEVKGKDVWILNVLVDATHHGETQTMRQNSGLVDLHSRKGNGRGSEWRSANKRRQLQTRTTNPRQHAKPRHPQVEGSLLKTGTQTYTQKCQPACSFSFYGAPPP